MNKENTQKLISEFPVVFSGVYETIKTNLMSFGFMCNDGWYSLVEDMARTCEEFNKKTIGSEYKKECTKEEIFKWRDTHPNLCIAVEVKEKYGRLCFYVHGGDDTCFDKETSIEIDSQKICEDCGKPGTTKAINLWYYTLCTQCFAKKESDLNTKSIELIDLP